MIHQIFNTEYQTQFFENYIELKNFDDLSFYKDFL